MNIQRENRTDPRKTYQQNGDFCGEKYSSESMAQINGRTEKYELIQALHCTFGIAMRIEAYF